MTDQTFESALNELNRLINSLKAPLKLPLSSRIDMQKAYLRASGLTLLNIDDLNIVHVAGSSGKSSTCAYIESVFRHEGYRTGLLTSPYLFNVEERIRINGNPLDRDIFARQFWLLHEKFNANVEMFSSFPKPLFLSFILHLTLGIFISQKVNVAIIEVDFGGRYDYTNFIRCPRVTLITSIELEHTEILGDTIQKVARSKAGIFKPKVPAIVAPDQPEDAMAVFVEEARTVGCPLFVAPRLADLQRSLHGDDVVLADWRRFVRGLYGLDVNEKNISLALAAVSLWHGRDDDTLPSESFDLPIDPKLVPTMSLCPSNQQLTGILSTRIPGRFNEVKISSGLTFFLDCAHTDESVGHCSKWFQVVSPTFSFDTGQRIYRILLFTVNGKCNPLSMLKQLSLLEFDAVYFTGNLKGILTIPPWLYPHPHECKAIWDELQTPTPSYELTGGQLTQLINTLKTWDGEASQLKLDFGVIDSSRIHVLVTGSVYLVGDVFSMLQPEYSIAWT